MTIRSFLYVPGNRPALFGKALASEADAVILDLEDAVPPSEKAAARTCLCDALTAAASGKPVFVRINDGAVGVEDTIALADAAVAPAGLLVPKAEAGGAIARIAALLDAGGSTQTAVRIQPIIESVAGLYALGELAAASPRVTRFSFGAGDFVADLGGTPTAERHETFVPRAEIALRSRRLGLLPPVAHVFTPIDDPAGLQRACGEDRALGFGARSCIHPKQVPIVNDAFGVDGEQLGWARAVLSRAAEEAARGVGAFRMANGDFIDEAILRRARVIVGMEARQR